ncbi:MAG: ABC transporter permease [Rickettsiales bacterium]|jgi:putative ABC transport system permease protein|nr:ABC transporter permease [Rickettsiales bacterium]
MIYLILREAIISLYSNKLRSLLTVLGVVIGVCAVVIMVAAGQAVQLEINKQLESFGANIMIIMPTSPSKNGVRGQRGGRPTLTIGDMQAVQKIEGVLMATPILRYGFQIVGGQNNWPTNVIGSTPDYFESFDYELEEGVYFTNYDALIGRSPYAVIGKTIKDKLFPFENPIGKDIKIKGVPFKVVGLLKEKGAGMGGNDEDDLIIVPLTTFKTRLTSNRFPDRVYLIVVKFDSINNMKMIERRLQALLEVRHKVSLNADPDFEIMNLTEIVNKIKLVGVILTILLASIASISLFVGSIGIMNMMLTSVTERTREIGVRKAIGATDHNILLQFLMESIFISIAGGIFGMIVGIILAKLASFISGYTVPISAITVTVSIFSALFVGVVSGIVPALKATKLNTIDALRYN